MRGLKLKSHRGFTLIELMATMAILGIIMIPISLVLFNGYKAYFEEYDRMVALSIANDGLNLIINDLRKFEESNTSVDSSNGQKLTINNNLIYKYDQSQKIILKNNTNIFSNYPDAKILNFNVIEKSETGFDARLILVSIDVEYNKSGVINLYNTYRRRY